MKPVREQMDALMRNVVDVVSPEELEAKLTRSVKTGTPLRVKLGIDPSNTYITLGNAVVLRKLRQFQAFGHHIVLIIGDYTGMVGDPTDRNEARPQLTHEQVLANASSFVAQAGRIIDTARTEIRYNGEWLGPMNFADVIRLASKYTVARMLEREDFHKRYQDGRPIFIHEFFYPLMQGHDSVAVRSDVELGGTEQKFNLLVGRDLQRDAGQEPQVCLMSPILEGTDGVQRMGKSRGNFIGVSEPPGEMYGKTMSIPDFIIGKWFRLTTDVPEAEIVRMEQGMAAGTVNPRDAKARLAREIVTLYHGSDAAQAAEQEFARMFQAKGLPEDIEVVRVSPTALGGTRVRATSLLRELGLVPSASEARRMLGQGAVATYDASGHEQRVEGEFAELDLADGMVIRVGKRRFVRLELAD